MTYNVDTIEGLGLFLTFNYKLHDLFIYQQPCCIAALTDLYCYYQVPLTFSITVVKVSINLPAP